MRKAKVIKGHIQIFQTRLEFQQFWLQHDHNIISLMLKQLTKLYRPFSTTIFDKILNKQIPSQAVYQDELIYAFKDVSPQAPVHVLIIPKNKDGLTGISKAEQRHANLLGEMLVKVPTIAEKLGLQKGYRLVINQGPQGQQTVDHIHIHLIGGRQMKWPPG